MHANNEIGNLLDIETAGNMAHSAGALFHCDTVQTMGHYAFDLSRGHIDYLAAAAHKFNGPKGVGFIYMNKAHRLPPQITGGAQEREVRGGTENVYGIIGMAKALEICYRDMEKKRSHIEQLKKNMVELLENEIPGVAFNGDCKGNCLYTVLSVSFPPSEAGNMLLFNLDIAGISASGGSACSSGSNAGSHVISAINPGTDRTTVRFSFGKFNTVEEIHTTVEKLKSWYPATVQA
jgi:cysteine desulfurase